ncbi:MAG: hypothetical protein HWE27_18040 [Gammaproteobacteria bacterium]|nr:hypothetical protein [Gammaproteobacteria bacterium]
MNFEILPGKFLIYNQARAWYIKIEQGLMFGPYRSYAESIKKAKSILVNADEAF